MNNFYIYIYLDSRKSGRYCYDDFCFLYKPIYIGKGSNRRWKNINGRTPIFINKFNKIKKFGLEPIIFKLYENLSESQSFEIEEKLIREIGRIDLRTGILINMTDGGEGTSGYKHTEKELEKRRKDFQEIKKEFKKRKGYILLTKEEDYKTNKTKLKYICPEGHESFINWSDFQRGYGCPYCAKKKIDFSDIKKEFEKRYYILLTEEKDYKNCYTKLEYICPEGHNGSMSWSNFQQGRCCPYCAKFKIYFSNIQKEFERKGYVLLTEEKNYKNNQTKLKYICPKGHEGFISWNNFQQGRGCVCNKGRKRKIQK